MARSTSKGNRYGRQGGGWLEDTPTADESDTSRKRREDDAARIGRERAEVAAYEAAHPEYVPGTVQHDGTRPAGGQLYADRARLAAARPADRRDPDDLEAIRRHPSPPSGLTGLPLPPNP